MVYTKCSEVLEKSRAQDDKIFCLGSDGGFMIPVHCKVGHEMRVHSERLVNGDGRKQLIPVYIEDNIFNFHLSKEVKSTDTVLVNIYRQLGNEYGRAARS